MSAKVRELLRTTHVVAASLHEPLAAIGVTLAEAQALAELGEAPSPTVGELAALLGHRPSTLTSVLDRLERRGLARRELAPQDRRTFAVVLTPAGRRAARAVVGAFDAAEAVLP